MIIRVFIMYFDNCLLGVGDSFNGIKNILKNWVLIFIYDLEIVLFKGYFIIFNYKYVFIIV